MKKKICKLTCFALCLMILASCLLSCSDAAKLNRMEEAERAFALYELIDETMDEADSYTMNMEGELSMTYSGVKVTSTVEGTIQESGIHEGSYVYFSESSTTLTASHEKIRLTSIEGYADGKMYRYDKGEENEQKLWSPISEADYRAHDEAIEDDFDFDITADNCKPLSCVQNDDKTWTATFAEFDENALWQFKSLFDGVEDMLSEGQRLDDVQIAICATKKLQLKSMDLVFVFVNQDEDSEAPLPEITVSCTVNNIGSTTAKTIDISSYTEVADLRQIDILEKHLNDFANAESGSFELKTHQNIAVQYSNGQVTDETDVVTFQNTPDGFTYNIDADVNGTKVTVAYVYGQKEVTVTGSSSSETTESTDFVEKQYIYDLFAPGNFSASNIANIRQIDGGYIFTFAVPDLSAFESSIASLNAEVEKSSASVTVQMTDDKLTEYRYDFYFRATSPQGDFSVTVSAICTYKD